MPLSRRKFIALLGGGTVLAATAGSAAFLSTRTPHAALAPWAAAGGPTDPRLNALSYAILAPNPHNRQPWVAELTGPDALRIWRDTTRDLPVTDPFDRQLTIGMGCFLETFAIAASAAGLDAAIALFPDAPARPGLEPVADIRLTATVAAPDPLFPYIPARRSSKEPFEDRMPDAPTLAPLADLARLVTDAPTVAALRALTWEAWEIEAKNPAAYRESVDLMRFGKAEIEANPDGIDLGGPFFEALIAARLLTREAQLDTNSQSYRTGFDIYSRMLAATPAYAVVSTPGNSREDQIAAGRTWMRLNLTATAQGLALHPVSQCLQEFPEMAPARARAQALLGAPGETVQMLGRLGYGPAALPPTPRWPLESRMLGA